VDYRARVSDNPIEDAFEQKKQSHISSSMKVVPPPFVPYAIDVLSNIRRTTKSAIYINVPFCQTRCAFCMFYISAYKKEESKRYTDNLIKEMRMWEKTKAAQSGPIHAVYLGGGTPTALEAEDLNRILCAVRDIFPLANDCEITVEGRVSYFTDQKIEACLKGGANRFSLGVQSFDTEIRQRLGRISTREELITSLENLASYDEAAVIIDLIFGLPGQDEKSVLDSIQTAAELPIDGADLYQLILLEGSPLEKMIRAGKMPDAYDSKGRARMYKAGCDLFSKLNFRPLSVSHFAKTYRERNLYNVMAKSDADVLSFGPGSGGKIQGISYMNARDYGKWTEMIESGSKSAFMMFVPKKNWRAMKVLGEQMELGFIDWNVLEKRFSLPLYDKSLEVVRQWEEAGLLQTSDGFSRFSMAGRFWAVNMVNLLTAYLDRQGI
ncbi:MAG: heme anaerobic degradation radical SAM methyltransferase ChuW/HutW, partial [Succinivibrio sp.]